MKTIAVLRQPSLIAVTGKYHGLGNRVRVVIGARGLARFEGRRFFYTWRTGAAFGARFSDLWQISDEVIPRSTARLLSARYPYRDEKLEWLTDSVRAARVLQIRTPHALHLPHGAVSWEHELQALLPDPSIRERVTSFFDERLSGPPYVGVMVRAHPNSHAVTLRESPIEWYVKRMHEIRDIFPGIQFYVSADTADAQRRVLDAMPGSHALDHKGAYNSREGLQSAVADLYLLASSAHLLGPYFSSFPELAQKLAGPGLLLETSHSDPASICGPGTLLSRVDDPIRPHLRLPA